MLTKITETYYNHLDTDNAISQICDNTNQPHLGDWLLRVILSAGYLTYSFRKSVEMLSNGKMHS